MKTNKNILSYLTQFCLEWKMFRTNIIEKLEIPILCSITFLEHCAVYQKMWKNI